MPTLAERKESLDLTKERGGFPFFDRLLWELYIIFIFSRYENLYIKKKIQVLYIQETWPPLKKGKPTIYPTIV